METSFLVIRDENDKNSLFGKFIPAAGDHGLWPWRNVQSCDRDVAPHGREAGYHRLCPGGSILLMQTH